ncbi:MAG: hypothetical protein ACLSUW_08300 [Akkermansia sp.]
MFILRPVVPFFIHGAPAVLNPNVEKPPYPDFIKHSQYSACGLGSSGPGKTGRFLQRSKLLKENGRLRQKYGTMPKQMWTLLHCGALPNGRISGNSRFLAETRH